MKTKLEIISTMGIRYLDVTETGVYLSFKKKDKIINIKLDTNGKILSKYTENMKQNSFKINKKQK